MNSPPSPSPSNYSSHSAWISRSLRGHTRVSFLLFLFCRLLPASGCCQGLYLLFVNGCPATSQNYNDSLYLWWMSSRRVRQLSPEKLTKKVVRVCMCVCVFMCVCECVGDLEDCDWRALQIWRLTSSASSSHSISLYVSFLPHAASPVLPHPHPFNPLDVWSLKTRRGGAMVTRTVSVDFSPASPPYCTFNALTCRVLSRPIDTTRLFWGALYSEAGEAILA